MLRHGCAQSGFVLLSADSFCLDCLEVIFERSVFFLGFVECAVGLRLLLFERSHLLLCGLEPPRAGKCACATRRRAAGHGTARLNDLSVQRDNAEAMSIRAGAKRQRSVHIFGNHRACE